MRPLKTKTVKHWSSALPCENLGLQSPHKFEGNFRDGFYHLSTRDIADSRVLQAFVS